MGAVQKSDASGQKGGGLETLLEGSPMCVAQLTESGHSCPLPPQCCFTASNILQEWQSDKVFFRAPWERRRSSSALRAQRSRRGRQRSQGGCPMI